MNTYFKTGKPLSVVTAKANYMHVLLGRRTANTSNRTLIYSLAAGGKQF